MVIKIRKIKTSKKNTNTEFFNDINKLFSYI